MRGFKGFKAAGNVLAAIAAFGAVLTSTAASAFPSFTQRIAPYGISGATPADLRSAMNAAGPVDRNAGRRYDAHTNAQIRWTVTAAPVADGCRIATVATAVDVTFTVPNWINSASANPAVRTKWDAYRANLMEHERGHARIAQEIASKIETAIRSLAAKPTCTEVIAAANGVGYDILRSDRSQQDYDRATNHGASQGATWH